MRVDITNWNDVAWAAVFDSAEVFLSDLIGKAMEVRSGKGHQKCGWFAAVPWVLAQPFDCLPTSPLPPTPLAPCGLQAMVQSTRMALVRSDVCLAADLSRMGECYGPHAFR